jgi:Xaa-Pro aminopeptidase
MPTRRTMVVSAAALAATPAAAQGTGAAAGSASGAGAGAAGREGARPLGQPTLPDISFAQREPFLNRERAEAMLRAEGFDALVLGGGRNVFYATNFFPLMERMSFTASALAVIPRDARRPVALVIPAFSYYYIQSDDGLVPGVQPFVFTSAAADTARAPGEAAAAALPNLYAAAADGLTPRENRRRAAVAAAAPYAVSFANALGKALQELGAANGRIGYDDLAIPSLLAAAAPRATAVQAEDTLRRIRLVRTAPELRMMRIAAQNNVDAALATVREMRSLGTLRAVRQRFHAEAALRGNTGVFMVVGGVSSDAYDEPLRDGTSVMIDCVSHCRNFHGDFGRTVFLGEPTRRAQQYADTLREVWFDLRTAIRPGLRFSEIRDRGAKTLARLGGDVPMFLNPHSVGLAHNDQPRLDPSGKPADHRVEPGMVLSIDCVLAEAGASGTAHLEDLVHVTATGVEAIHETGSTTYTV